MKTGKIVLAAIAGTTAMTVFSYIVSRKKNKDFREPALLGKMVYRAIPGISKKTAKICGWALHYTTGFTFALVYEELLKNNIIKKSMVDDTIVGIVNGLAASLIWKATFSLHPDPPEIHFNDYYKHLVLAHLVFAITTLSVMEKDEAFV